MEQMFELKIRTVGRSRQEAVELANDVLGKVDRCDSIISCTEHFEDNTLFECVIIQESKGLDNAK